MLTWRVATWSWQQMEQQTMRLILKRTGILMMMVMTANKSKMLDLMV